MKSRFALFALVAFLLLALPGADCGRRHWELRLLPNIHTVFVGDELAVQVTAEPTPAVGYSLDIDWGDTTVVLNEDLRPDTFAVSHRWDSAGVYGVRAWGHTSAGWWPAYSEPETVTVLVGGPHAPIVDSVLVPLVVVRGLVTNLTFYVHDPDGDSMRAVVAWSDTTDTMTSLSPNPAIITVSHVFTTVETAKVVASVRDRNGAVSLPDTILVPVVPSAGPPSHWPKWQHDLYNTGFVGGGR
jgi:hypothetical protein